MFERFEQYLTYHIEPPETLVEMHQKWVERKGSNDQDREIKKIASNWRHGLVKTWKDRVKKWEYREPKQDKPKCKRGRLCEVDLGQKGYAKTGDSFAVEENANAFKIISRIHLGTNENDVTSEETIIMQKWDPTAQYFQHLIDSFKDDNTAMAAYHEYMKLRSSFRNAPKFYFDCAKLFFKENQTKLALRILSNLSEINALNDKELNKANVWLLRAMGKESDWWLIGSFPYRALANALESIKKIKEKKDMETVKNILNFNLKHVIGYGENEGFTRYFGYKPDYIQLALIAINEYNALYAWCTRQKWPKGAKCPKPYEEGSSYRPDTLMKPFMKNMEADVRIVIISNNSRSIQFSVTPPDDVRSIDTIPVCDSYCIEEHLYKKSKKGKYIIKASYESSSNREFEIPPIVEITFYTNWGRGKQKRQTVTKLLSGNGKVAEFVF